MDEDDEEVDGFEMERDQILEIAMTIVFREATRHEFSMDRMPMKAAMMTLGLDSRLACGALYTMGMNCGAILREHVTEKGIPIDKVGMGFRLRDGDGDPIENEQAMFGSPSHRCGQIITAGALDDDDMCHDLCHATVGQGGEYAEAVFKSLVLNYHMFSVHPEAVRFGFELIPGVDVEKDFG